MFENEGARQVIFKMKVKDAAFEALYKINRRLGVRILKEREGWKAGR